MKTASPKSPIGIGPSITASLFEGPDSPAYFERAGGPLVIRGDQDIPPTVIGQAVHHMRRSYLEYLTACDGVLSGESQRAREAGDLAVEIFRHCDAYAADISIKDLFK